MVWHFGKDFLGFQYCNFHGLSLLPWYMHGVLGFEEIPDVQDFSPFLKLILFYLIFAP